MKVITTMFKSVIASVVFGFGLSVANVTFADVVYDDFAEACTQFIEKAGEAIDKMPSPDGEDANKARQFLVDAKKEQNGEDCIKKAVEAFKIVQGSK